MSDPTQDAAGQDTETYDGVVRDLNFDPANPDSRPRPDRAAGAHSASGSSGEPQAEAHASPDDADD